MSKVKSKKTSKKATTPKKEVEDAASKKLFQVLAQEEAGHKLFLETKYDDYMAKMGD